MEYGLIGEKLGHSHSPKIHNMIGDYNYRLMPLAKDEFPKFMESRDFKGINVTIPYKQDVIPYLDEMDDTARVVGAVNTIVNIDGRLKGYNTDFGGLLYTLVHNNIMIEGKKVLVLGNGGAAKAVIAVLNHMKASEIVLVGRSAREGCITYEDCYMNHRDGQVVVNTTPLGMYPMVDGCPLDLTCFRDCEAVVDLIYNPLKTKLLIHAEELGMLAVNGLEMLVAQAVYASEFFFHKKYDEEIIGKIYKVMVNDLSE